jgi:methionine sulfoxide reductase heme-binding subunit
MIASTKFWWFASRASGLVLWLLLGASISWGLAIVARLLRNKVNAAWMLDLHKHLGTLSLVFTGVHLLSLWGDNYVKFGPRELFIPMASPWRPGAVTWGIVAMYLLVIVQVSSWVMKKIPRQLWHTLHMLSVPLFVTGSIHGVLSGADWKNRWAQWGLVVGCTSVVWLGTFRLLAPNKGGGANQERLAAAREAALAAKQAPVPGSAIAATDDALAGRPVRPARPARPASPQLATLPPPAGEPVRHISRPPVDV